MEDMVEECNTVFTQDGVLLKQASSFYIHYLNCTGTLHIREYTIGTQKTRFIEWEKQQNENDAVDSDIQDQEWAVINRVEQNASSNHQQEQRSKIIKVNMNDMKSFKVTKKADRLTLLDGKSEVICNFFFQHGNCTCLVNMLKRLLKTTYSKRDKLLHIIIEDVDETRQLDRSFAELNLFQDSKSNYNIWNLVKNIQPYETTMEAFSKITDNFVMAPRERPINEYAQEVFNSVSMDTSTAAARSDEYEVVPTYPELPLRKDYPRGCALTFEQWRDLQDHEGKIEDVEFTKLHIFRGGLTPSLRAELWKYLLDYYPWDSTTQQRQAMVKQKKDEYYMMKLQWKTMTRMQEENFADYRERKSLIEKDVNRTDRTLNYYSGDNNPNLVTLNEILMTYVMYNFDLGYVQGMSDLLSPILHLMDNEVDAFWCFVGFMNKVSSNFDLDQAGMKEQLENLHTLLSFADPHLANYLDRHDSGNMFFCFRWLLVWFKRELSQEDVMRLWEVLWTGLPCQNFHLLISVAILETEKQKLIDNNYGFTEILKHINDLSGQLDLNAMLNKAEGIYNQIKSALHLTDEVRIILGLPVLTNNVYGTSPNGSTSSNEPCSLETLNMVDNEVYYERAISNSYM